LLQLKVLRGLNSLVYVILQSRHYCNAAAVPDAIAAAVILGVWVVSGHSSAASEMLVGTVIDALVDCPADRSELIQTSKHAAAKYIRPCLGVIFSRLAAAL
jgi:hypothetical protein